MSDAQASPVSLEQIEQLYDAGRVFDALQLGASRGPLSAWAGAGGRVMAGRIAMNLGAPRLGRLLHLRAHREHPDDPTAAYYHVRALMERRGVLAAVEQVRRLGTPTAGSPDLRADWLSMRASTAAAYRDFEAADRLLAEAVDVAPDRAWTRVEQAFVLEQADRYDDAMASARLALEMQPWMRPAVQQVAHLLQVRDRDRQALDLLTEAADRIQSVPLMQQLAALQDHLGLYPQAMATLARLDAWVVVRERRFQDALAWVRSNVLYHAGDYPGAIAAAQGCDDEWVKQVAVTLRAQVDAGQAKPRVRIDLPFVRQHHMTCAPATLTAISRYWGQPADHLELVEAICYDGTPSYNQRDWATSNGWVAREFRLTWEVAVALVDRSVPFTLATVTVGSAHLQAVVGYDPMRGTLLCRDPYLYYETELSAEPLLRYNAAFGPHCMVMVPPAEAHRLDGIDLPDAALHDLMHDLERALANHDRPAAVAARDALSAAAPDHRLARSADRAVAAYDRDAEAALSAVDALLERFPDSRPLRLWRAYDLRTLGRRDELTRELADTCGRATAEPEFLHLFAEHLRNDGGDDGRVVALLRRALRRRPTHPASLATLGHVRWGQRRLDEATELYRLTACVDDKNEYPSRTYLVACRHRGQVERAMAMLTARFERSGRQSGQPGCTLAWAHEQLDRVTEAMAVLDRARQLRPDDGQLLLHAADLYGRRADVPRARELLERARDRTRPADWLRSAARIAEYDGHPAEALAVWRSVLAAEPTAEDAYEAAARLLAETASPAEAVAFLQAACDRFPYRTPLHEWRIMWLRQVGSGAVAAAAAELVDRRPANVWARVELSLSLAALGRATEALGQAEQALALSPTAPNAHQAAGRALEGLGRFPEAREHFRRAVESSVDYTAGIHALFDAADGAAAAAEALSFVADRFDFAGLFGDGLVTFAGLALNVLPHDRVERILRDANAARPDVWQTWSALARFLCNVGQLDAADRAARGMVDRFSLLPRAWLDLSDVHGYRGDRDGQTAALRHCLALSPGWSMASRRLAEAVRKAGDLPGAVAVMRASIARDPLDAENHAVLANQLWASNDRAAAIAAGRRAVSLSPWLSKTWDAVRQWSREVGEPDAVVELARDVARRRAGESIAWMVLARSLSGPSARDERLDACRRAIALSPTSSDAHDLTAWLLSDAGRFDEALAACDPPQFGGRPPVELRGRAAWILDRRGDRSAAVAAMSALVRENPGYTWGWQELLGWLEKGPDAAAYLGAATDMVAHLPNASLARNHLAHAQLAVKDRPAARATLERSAVLFPDNDYVVGKLFSLQLEDRDHAAAAATLELARRHQTAEEAASMGVRLAAATGDAPRAATDLTTLCRLPDSQYGGAIADAVKTMDAAKMTGTVNRVLIDVLAGTGDVNPEAGAVRVRRLTQIKAWRKCRDLMAHLRGRPAVWRAAVVPYLEGLSGAKRGRRLVRFVRRHDADIRPSGRAWGAVTFSLTSVNRYRACADWCHDWRGRTDVQPWMLLNVAASNRRIGRRATAALVTAHAVSLPDDGTRLKHQLWLAIDEVTAGRRGPATAAVLAADAAKLDKHYPYLLRVVQALAPLCDDPADGDGRAARRQLAAAFRQFRHWKIPDVSHVHRSAARRVARARSNPLNWAWALSTNLDVWFHPR